MGLPILLSHREKGEGFPVRETDKSEGSLELENLLASLSLHLSFYLSDPCNRKQTPRRWFSFSSALLPVSRTAKGAEVH